jgi:Xaa-Pro aminopeptidase
MNTERRVDALRSSISQQKCDAIVLSNAISVRYISGFSGDDSLALVTPDRRFIITDFRYVEQVEQECPGWEVVKRKLDVYDAAARVAKACKVKRLGFEAGHISYASYRRFLKCAKGLRLAPTTGIVDRMRMIKDADEVAAIEAAIRCQEAAFREVRKWLKPGVTELDVATELEYRMRRHGAQRWAFETITAGAERGSLPHARPTERLVRKGEALLLDWGARCFFYNSDLTRVLHFGKVTSRFRKIYSIVKQAQELGIAAVRPGARLSDIDLAAREHIRKAGFGPQFGHSLGHGVGLDVHEAPTVREASKELAQPGMVFTIEPGIYIPRWGGVRIEDMVLVTERGVRVLSTLTKELDEMIL